MKKSYIRPLSCIVRMDPEGLMAASEMQMERGEGDGGNQAEVKSERSFSNPVNWDE